MPRAPITIPDKGFAKVKPGMEIRFIRPSEKPKANPVNTPIIQRTTTQGE